ncbi:MAG: sigma-70 family RNA polymerase sigma factor [Tannerellaceae bacterium]|nr:sigma-70 family RNA polymerase sigma factor [Tannerellaceae bacterium]
MTAEQLTEYIEKCKQGDSHSFGMLVHEFQPMVYRLSFRLLADPDETKDAVQETFIKVWLSIRSYNPGYKFTTWLFKIACNTCHDRLRKLQHQPESADWFESFQRLDSGENIENTLINKDLKEVILHLTEKLTPKQKMVFVLSDLEEMDVGEIETVTGLTPAKIKSNLYLARKYIRTKLSNLE